MTIQRCSPLEASHHLRHPRRRHQLLDLDEVSIGVFDAQQLRKADPLLALDEQLPLRLIVGGIAPKAQRILDALDPLRTQADPLAHRDAEAQHALLCRRQTRHDQSNVAERVRAPRGGRDVDVVRARKVLELNHSIRVVFLPQQLRARLVPGPVPPAVRVAHVCHAVGRRELCREQMPHAQHVAVEFHAGRQVRDDQREVVDCVAQCFWRGGPVVPNCEEVVGWEGHVGAGVRGVLSRVDDAALGPLQAEAEERQAAVSGERG